MLPAQALNSLETVFVEFVLQPLPREFPGLSDVDILPGVSLFA